MPWVHIRSTVSLSKGGALLFNAQGRWCGHYMRCGHGLTDIVLLTPLCKTTKKAKEAAVVRGRGCRLIPKRRHMKPPRRL